MDILCIDMDNTIIDSDKPHLLGYIKAFKENNLKKVSQKDIKKHFGLVSSEIIRRLFPELSNTEIKKVLNDNERFFIESKKHLKAFPGVKKTLEILRKKYKLVLISNCNTNEIKISLNRAKINQKLFSLLISSNDVKNPKPKPDEILFAERKLKQKVSYVIGDSIYDIQAGKKAKVKTIAVITGNNTKSQLKKEKPDYIIDNFNNVLKIL